MSTLTEYMSALIFCQGAPLFAKRPEQGTKIACCAGLLSRVSCLARQQIDDVTQDGFDYFKAFAHRLR